MAAFKGLNTPTEATRPGRAVALVGLAILATALVGAGATAPPASPIRVEVPVAAAGEPARAVGARSFCSEGVGGRFTRTSGGDDEGDFDLQHSLGDGSRLCAVVRGPVRFDERSGAIHTLGAGGSVLVETRGRQGGSQKMRVTSEGGELRYEWSLNGAVRPVDDGARAWLADALEVVAAYQEIGRIQGQIGSLQGEIGSIQGEIGSLQGQIGSIQGEIGSLQGRIGSIQGERGSLQGEIGSHRGAIGGLQGARWNASASLEKQIDTEIRQHEAEIRKLEAKLESSDFRKRLDDAEAELETYQKTARGEIAELEKQIDAIRARDEIGKLEKQIEDMHADDRIDAIKRRVAPTVERLQGQIRKLGS
jgi:predicted  nucleic acid-binding Zn-ribbon protein